MRRVRILHAVLLGAAWLLPCSFSLGQAGNLPPFKTLLEGCRKSLSDLEAADGDKSPSEAALLAEAQVEFGDEAAGLKSAQAIENSYWRSMALWSCMQVQARRGTFQGELPENIDEEFRDLILLDVAKAYADTGHFAKAFAVAQRIPRSRGMRFRFGEFYRDTAQAQLLHNAPRKDLEATLEQGLAAFADPFRLSRTIEQLLSLGETARKAGARSHAQKCIDLAVEITDREHKKRAPYEWTAVDWARIAQAQRSLGQNDASEASFRQAVEIAASMSIPAQGESSSPQSSDRNALVKTFATIGAIQWTCDRPEEARRSFDKAIHHATAEDDPQTSSFLLHFVTEAQLKHGDLKGAAVTAKFMRSPYFRALYHCGAAAAESSLGNKAEMTRHFAEALKLADAENQLVNKTALLTEIAISRNTVGDPEGARKDFQRALDGADGAETREKAIGHYQRVAMFQVKAGFFADAYTTIQAMGNSERRTLPFAQLVLAVAKSKNGQMPDAK